MLTVIGPREGSSCYDMFTLFLPTHHSICSVPNPGDTEGIDLTLVYDHLAFAEYSLGNYRKALQYTKDLLQNGKCTNHLFCCQCMIMSVFRFCLKRRLVANFTLQKACRNLLHVFCPSQCHKMTSHGSMPGTIF